MRSFGECCPCDSALTRTDGKGSCAKHGFARHVFEAASDRPEMTLRQGTANQWMASLELGGDGIEGIMNRTAIITGGASIVGMAITEHLLEGGWSVAIVDSDQEAAKVAEDAFSGEEVLVLPADVSDEDEIDRAFDTVVDTLGLCSALINCAGIRPEATFEDTSVELLREALELNLVAPFVAAQAAFARMVDQLAIINIISTSALQARRGRAAIAASHAGLRMMTEILALENLDRPVRVNCIATAGDGSRRKIWTSTPSRVPGTEEIVGAVSYLLSDAARMVSGQTLVLGSDESD